MPTYIDLAVATRHELSRKYSMCIWYGYHSEVIKNDKNCASNLSNDFYNQNTKHFVQPGSNLNPVF